MSHGKESKTKIKRNIDISEERVRFVKGENKNITIACPGVMTEVKKMSYNGKEIDLKDVVKITWVAEAGEIPRLIIEQSVFENKG